MAKKWKTNLITDIDFASLKSTLLDANLQQSNTALYQFLDQLLNKIKQNKTLTNTLLERITGDIVVDDTSNLQAILDAISQINQIIQFVTFWTKDDESVSLPSSLQVIAGAGITLDYSVPNQVTVIATGAGSGDGILPMVNGAEPPELMSNGVGDLIIIPYTS